MTGTHLPAFFNANGDTTLTYGSRWHWRRTVQIKGPLFQVAIAIGNSFISPCTHVIRHIDYPYNELPLSWYPSITYPQGTGDFLRNQFCSLHFAPKQMMSTPQTSAWFFLIIYGSTSPQPMALMIGTRSWSLASVEDNSYGGGSPHGPNPKGWHPPHPPPRNSQEPPLLRENGAFIHWPESRRFSFLDHFWGQQGKG